MTITVRTVAMHENRPMTIDWTFTPGDPGNIIGPVEACYPPEPAELESVTVRIHTSTGFVTFADGETWIRENLGGETFEMLYDDALQSDDVIDWGEYDPD